MLSRDFMCERNLFAFTAKIDMWDAAVQSSKKNMLLLLSFPYLLNKYLPRELDDIIITFSTPSSTKSLPPLWDQDVQNLFPLHIFRIHLNLTLMYVSRSTEGMQ